MPSIQDLEAQIELLLSRIMELELLCEVYGIDHRPSTLKHLRPHTTRTARPEDVQLEAPLVPPSGAMTVGMV